MTPDEIIESLREVTEGEGILYDGLEEALIGICRRFNHPPVALYDYHKCIEILLRDYEGDDPERAYEEVVEHLEFNTMGLWAGEYTPAFAVTKEA